MSQQTYEQMSDRPLLLGALADLGPRDVISGINSSPGAAQVDTMTILNYVAAKELNWTIDGVPFSYVMTVADADVTGVAHSITEQLQAEPIFGGRFVATHLLGVITLTARFPGVGWTILATGANAADNAIANVTANTAAAALPYGRLTLDDGQVTSSLEKKVKLAAATALTARVVSAVPSHEDATVFYCSVKVNGRTYLASYDSTGAHTVANIVAALKATLNAQLPASTVDVQDTGNDKLILTAEVAGLAFEYTFGADKVGLWTITETAYTKATDVNEAAVGIALRSDSIETNSDTTPGYPANRACSVLKKGRVVVQTATQIDPTKRVFVRLASATTASPLGSFDDDAGTGLVELDPRRFRWSAVASSTRAILQVNCD